MKQDPLKKKSKLLSLILRHKPETVGLELGEGGWVDIDALLAGLKSINRAMTREELLEVVKKNDKKRYSISDDGLRIRAAQGHTVDIDLDLKPKTPPTVLYHGTATSTLPAINDEGIRSIWRQHVHLSADIETAIKVGQRHGKPAVLQVNALGLSQAGQTFYQADNGVWLTDTVAPDWFEQIKI